MTLTLTTEGLQELQASRQSYKLKLSVTAGQGNRSEVFVKQRVRNSSQATEDIFVAIATPSQLEDLPVNVPAEDTTYFRTSSIELVNSSPEILKTILNAILVELQQLTDDLEALATEASKSVFVINSGSTIGLADPESLPAVVQMIFSGSSSPEGVVTAPVGSIYSQIISGVFVKLWIKTVGSSATGWV